MLETPITTSPRSRRSLPWFLFHEHVTRCSLFFLNEHSWQGYTKPREYIVTEWPLRHTCGEFWSLVYDYECAAVVVLCVPPPGSTNFPSFWPEGKHSKKYGPVFTIDHISHNHYTNIKTWVRSNIFFSFCYFWSFFDLNLRKKLYKKYSSFSFINYL